MNAFVTYTRVTDATAQEAICQARMIATVERYTAERWAVVLKKNGAEEYAFYVDDRVAPVIPTAKLDLAVEKLVEPVGTKPGETAWKPVVTAGEAGESAAMEKTK